MSTTEERMQILSMIEKGQITAQEGSRLLEALEKSEDRAEKSSSGKPRWFRVRVTDLGTGKRKVNVNIPMGLVNVGMRMGAKFAPEMGDVNIEEIMEMVKNGAQGKIIDVEDDEDGERVEIYVE